ncbi:MAG: hypothetical protein QOF21_1284, partial [Actinomycetota bacterium]
VVKEPKDSRLARVDSDASVLGAVQQKRDDAVVARVGVPRHTGAAVDHEGKFHGLNDDGRV